MSRSDVRSRLKVRSSHRLWRLGRGAMGPPGAFEAPPQEAEKASEVVGAPSPKRQKLESPPSPVDSERC